MNIEAIPHLQEAEHHLSLARVALRDAVKLIGKTELSDLTDQEAEVLNIANAIDSYGVDLFLLTERN